MPPYQLCCSIDYRLIFPSGFVRGAERKSIDLTDRLQQRRADKLSYAEAADFANFLRRMLKLKPKRRATAKSLLQDINGEGGVRPNQLSIDNY